MPGDVTKGTGWHWDTRGWVEIDGDGAVFSGFAVAANVNVTGDNVTVANNRIVYSDAGGFGVSIRHAAGTIISHNTIGGPSANGGSDRILVGVKNIYGDETGTQVIGNNIQDTSTGVQIDSGVVQGNFIHGMGYISGDHTNGVTSNAGGSMLTISHNTILNARDQTDAVSLFQDFGVQRNRIIDNNLLAGGGYTIYGGANPGKAQTSNIIITNNRISTMYYSKGGSYGAVTAVDNGPGNSWSGNIWDGTGKAVGL